MSNEEINEILKFKNKFDPAYSNTNCPNCGYNCTLRITDVMIKEIVEEHDKVDDI